MHIHIMCSVYSCVCLQGYIANYWPSMNNTPFLVIFTYPCEQGWFWQPCYLFWFYNIVFSTLLSCKHTLNYVKDLIQ